MAFTPEQLTILFNFSNFDYKYSNQQFIPLSDLIKFLGFDFHN